MHKIDQKPVHTEIISVVARNNEKERVVLARNLVPVKDTVQQERAAVSAHAYDCSENEGLPTLEYSNFFTSRQQGMTTLLLAMMELSQKTTSLFYTAQMEQGTEAMSNELSLATEVGKQTLASYTTQSQEETVQADQSKSEGIASIMSFGAAIVAGGVMEAKDPSVDTSDDAEFAVKDTEPTEPKPSTLPANDEIDLENLDEEDAGNLTTPRGRAQLNEVRALSTDPGQGVGGANSDAEAEAQGAAAEDAQGTQTRANVTTNNIQANDANAAAAKDAVDAKSGTTLENLKRTGAQATKTFKRLSTRFGGMVKNAINAAQMVNMGSEGITKLTITAPAQRQLAALKLVEGEATAASKIAEQLSQFWGQYYSRSEDQRTAAQQYIDFVVNLFKSAIDTVTQTNARIFS